VDTFSERENGALAQGNPGLQGLPKSRFIVRGPIGRAEHN